MFRFTIDFDLFKKTIDVLDKIVSDVNITWSESDFQVESLDNTHTMLVNWYCRPSKVDCNGLGNTGISIAATKKICKCIIPKGTTKVEITFSEEDVLFGDYVAMSCLDIDTEVLVITTAGFFEFCVDCVQFETIVTSFKSVAVDDICISLIGTDLVFTGVSDEKRIKNLRLCLPVKDKVCRQGDAQTGLEHKQGSFVDRKFATKLLCNIVTSKLSALCRIMMQENPDAPLLIEYTYPLGDLRFALGSKI